MRNDRSFLGTGWAFPPTFSKGGADVAVVSDAEDIHQSLQILLSTQIGERVMQDEFGCDMNRFLFEEVSQSLVNSLHRLVSEAILYHEPRIELQGLDVTESESEPGVLLITIDYTVRTTNSRFNMVFPFYQKEAVGGMVGV